jgi:dCTP diphosphatase
MESDKTTTIESLKAQMRLFGDEREWGQFHSPKNLSMALAAEGAELMEFFIWVDSVSSIDEFEKNREEVENEIADIASYLFSFCSRYNIDLTQAFKRKMEINALRYPVEKSKGRATKYTNL